MQVMVDRHAAQIESVFPNPEVTRSVALPLADMSEGTLNSDALAMRSRSFVRPY